MSEAFDPREFLPRPDVSSINERGVDFTRREITKYCDEIVDLTYSGVSAYLEADKELTDRLLAQITSDEVLPKGEIFGVFVKQNNFLSTPVQDGEPIRTFCTRLEPISREDNGEYDEDAGVDVEALESELPDEPLREDDKRYMKLHVPVGALSINDFQMPNPKMVPQVFIESFDGEETRWYAIQRNGYMYEYIPYVYQNEASNQDLTKREWEQLYKEGVPEVHATVTELLQHIVDWKTVAQSLRTI